MPIDVGLESLLLFLNRYWPSASTSTLFKVNYETQLKNVNCFNVFIDSFKQISNIGQLYLLFNLGILYFLQSFQSQQQQ